MEVFTGLEYLMIDIANHFGLDKENFDKRLNWVDTNNKILESKIQEADEPYLFQKAVMALRDVQEGRPTGHMVGFDSTASGLQIMSAITNCEVGAYYTNLIDPDNRIDAYTELNKIQQSILGHKSQVERKDSKQALMTVLYGSKATPKEIFGEDTPELVAFYKAVLEIAPGAWELLQCLLDSWQPRNYAHTWSLPDGFIAKVNVIDIERHRIEVDELNHHRFNFEFYVNKPMERGLSNVANVIHSIDGYIVRSIQRRCNYNKEVITKTHKIISDELMFRLIGHSKGPEEGQGIQQKYLKEIRFVEEVQPHTAHLYTTVQLSVWKEILDKMLMYDPFPVVTVHDEFKVHAQNVTYLRWHYKEIMADLAESNILDSIFTNIYNEEKKYKKEGNIGYKIRKANYHIC